MLCLHWYLSTMLTALDRIWLLQGDRTENVGVVDSEYVVHQGLPTLGGASARKVIILKLLLILRFLFDFSYTSCFLYHFISITEKYVICLQFHLLSANG